MFHSIGHDGNGLLVGICELESKIVTEAMFCARKHKSDTDIFQAPAITTSDEVANCLSFTVKGPAHFNTLDTVETFARCC